jgi:8-oxo-dGTP diphosphatase
MRKSVRAVVIKDDKLLLMKRNKFGDVFYSLVGGGIDYGETAEQSLHRELLEEASIAVQNPRLIIIEDAGPIFGEQYIFLCDYVHGDVALSPDSEEAKIHALGQNLYQPVWMPLSELPDIRLLPVELKQLVIEYLNSGFPNEPVSLIVRS